ncbi:MAG: hypothetical protein IPH94_20325 [Saprospiraceae bacterium]|jgi:hypothetical protein|nr:hypothetical protein [Saprospiraceae bacterium]
MKKVLLAFICALVFLPVTNAQEDDLLSLLGEEETTDYANAAFKTNRVINLHSLENTAAGAFDFKISHRFGFISGGVQELFGLDASTIRIGGDYGISNRLMVGFGRSSYEKTYDVFGKYKLLRQSSGKKNMPITAALFASAAIKTIPFSDPERDNYFSSRLYYTWQLILGRKFSEGFSLQVSPTLVHRNLTATVAEKNDVYAVAGAGRIKLSKRIALNAEYIYVLPDQIASRYRNSLSLGFDIETGGHVFQLHFTNSTSMIEKGFVTETSGNWLDGDIHFGFNVSRVFTFKNFEHE